MPPYMLKITSPKDPPSMHIPKLEERENGLGFWLGFNCLSRFVKTTKISLKAKIDTIVDLKY